MKYRIELIGSAEREFLKLPKTERLKIGNRIDALGDNPRPHGSAKMSGHRNLWRIRVGNYRVLYAIEEAPMIVAITRVAHRREVYRGI